MSRSKRCPVVRCGKPSAATSAFDRVPPFCDTHRNWAVANAEGDPVQPAKTKVRVVLTGEVRYRCRKVVEMSQEAFLTLQKADVEESQRDIDAIVQGWMENDLSATISDADDGDFEDCDFSFWQPEKKKK